MYYDVIMMISVSQYTSSNARFIGQSMFQKYLSQNGFTGAFDGSLSR